MKVYTSIKPGPNVFISRSTERFVRAAFYAEFQFGGIGVSHVIAQHAGERFGSGGRYGTMAAGILRKRRRLQVRPPFGINVLIDHSFGAGGVIGVFSRPRFNKGVKQRYGGFGVGIYRFVKIGIYLFGANAHNT